MHGGSSVGGAPSVSVILPFLNETRFLEAAIDTVRGQHEANWELLLVDDGSTDGSGQLADGIAATDPDRIRVFRHPGRANRGLPASRNLALCRARASVVAFLDADDRWLPTKLSRQLDMLASNPTAGMACGPSVRRFLDDDDRPDDVRIVTDDAPKLFARRKFAQQLVWGTLDPPTPSSTVFRTDALRRVGGVPDGPNMHEDQRAYVAMSARYPVFVSDEPLTIYIVRADSMYHSIANDPHATYRHQQNFERWIVRVGPSFGWHGSLLAAEAVVRKAVSRARSSRLGWMVPR